MLLACGTATSIRKCCRHEPAETFVSTYNELSVSSSIELKDRKEDLHSDNSVFPEREYFASLLIKVRHPW